MSDPGDGGDSPRRALLVAGAAMAGVALVVGLAIGAALVGAVRFSGLASAGSSSAASQPSLYMPKYQPTRTPSTVAAQSSATPTESLAPTPTSPPQTGTIKLFAAPQRVAPGGRINLNGVYVDGEGVALQIQRKEPGGWADFPVKTTVQGGSFNTWITTSHTGRNVLRVYDVQANRASNVVTVTVG
jgi:hypothetical protein